MSGDHAEVAASSEIYEDGETSAFSEDGERQGLQRVSLQPPLLLLVASAPRDSKNNLH